MKFNDIINEMLGKIVFAEQLKKIIFVYVYIFSNIAYRLDSSKRWNNVENLTLLNKVLRLF